MSAFWLAFSIIAVIAAVVAFLLFSDRCKHQYQAPTRTKIGEWYYHEFTMPHPQLKGEIFRVYRRDVVLTHVCRKCHHVKTTTCYDQKPHESDTMHKTPENWKPEPAPAPLTEEALKKLRR